VSLSVNHITRAVALSNATVRRGSALRELNSHVQALRFYEPRYARHGIAMYRTTPNKTCREFRRAGDKWRPLSWLDKDNPIHQPLGIKPNLNACPRLDRRGFRKIRPPSSASWAIRRLDRVSPHRFLSSSDGARPARPLDFSIFTLPFFSATRPKRSR